MDRILFVTIVIACAIWIGATINRNEYSTHEYKYATVKPFTIEPDSVLTPAPKTIYCYTGCYGRPEKGTIIMVNDTSVMEFKFSRVVKLK